MCIRCAQLDASPAASPRSAKRKRSPLARTSSSHAPTAAPSPAALSIATYSKMRQRTVSTRSSPRGVRSMRTVAIANSRSPSLPAETAVASPSACRHA